MHGKAIRTLVAMDDAAVGVDEQGRMRMPVHDPEQHIRQVTRLTQPPAILERERDVRKHRPEIRFLALPERRLVLPPVEADAMDQLSATYRDARQAMKDIVRLEQTSVKIGLHQIPVV